MNATWAKNYGFGAARIPLAAAGLRPEAAASFGAAAREAQLARVAGASLGVLCAFVLWLAFSPAQDAGPLRIVMLDTEANPQPEPHAEPPPLPVPEAVPEPEIEVATAAPPEPVAAPEPAPIAQVEPVAEPLPEAAPPEPARIKRVVQVEPIRAPRPKPEAHRPVRQPRPAPSIAGPAAPLLPDLAAPDAPAPFEVASARTPRRERAIRKRLPGAPAAPAPANLAPAATPRTERAERARPERRSSPPAAARPRALPAARTPKVPAPLAAAPSRAARPTPAAPQRSTPENPKLRGVALGSLASCVSDRQEDALKQRLIREVAEPGMCSNAQGTWSFVETKNLNAFLMWVDRGSERAGDRCAELNRALRCVKQQGVRESS